MSTEPEIVVDEEYYVKRLAPAISDIRELKQRLVSNNVGRLVSIEIDFLDGKGPQKIKYSQSNYEETQPSRLPFRILHLEHIDGCQCEMHTKK